VAFVFWYRSGHGVVGQFLIPAISGGFDGGGKEKFHQFVPMLAPP
jgi:hypothetical protein